MLSLNLRDSRPIYEQVRDGLRRLIITGAIPPGDKLPSVRTWRGSWPSTPTPSSAPMKPWSGRATPTRCRARAASPPCPRT